MTAKVLHLITHLGIGGAQDHTLLTVQRLPRDRYEVHLAAGFDESDWVARAQAVSDRLHLLPHLRRQMQPRDDARALADLVALLRHERYDIVHTHSSKAGALGRLAARLAGTPLVVHTVHGLPWTPAMPSAKRRFFQQIERILALLSDALITVAEHNRAELLALGIHPNRVTTIYSGVEVDRFPPAIDRVEGRRRLGLPPDALVVGSVARLSPQKAPLDLIAAARHVTRVLPRTQIVLVGDGPLRDEVQAACRGIDNIHLLGARPDVASILPLFDCFALASRWEGVGRALTEALLAGLPAAVTAVDGVPELILHEQTGLLSPPGRPELLARNIVRLLDDKALAASCAARGRERARQQFTASAMIEQIDALYQRLAAVPRSRRGTGQRRAGTLL